jgi:hypothetical protein
MGAISMNWHMTSEDESLDEAKTKVAIKIASSILQEGITRLLIKICTDQVAESYFQVTGHSFGFGMLGMRGTPDDGITEEHLQGLPIEVHY